MHKMQHITEKEFDILKYFYEKPRGYVRQIKKSVKLSEHTLLKYLDSLEKKKILSSKREGNLKIYDINLKNSFVKVFFSYFDLERLELLEYKRQKAIALFVESIKQIKIPGFILLFGSTAKGNYTPKSDIDLILVYELLEKDINKKIKNINQKILAETGLKISSIIMKLNEFLKEKENKQNYALQDAITSGYPVFGNQLYYEVMFE
ncbi:MAG: nucleotidyltransferase domain-containing protein [Nanoarchaeota archaeon]|nr:nucleotidyltransferase domain-containing protein [Nanoarchaeota archaeon]